MRNSASVLAGFLLLALLGLSACYRPSSIGSTLSSSSARRPNAALQESDARTAQKSSLESFREGDVPVSPPSSPLKAIYFDYDRYELRADAREVLKGNARWLQANPAVGVEVEGHSDERGTSEYNLALAAKRAQTAKEYLLILGISGGRLSTISYGEEVPVCRERNEECWQKNRRDRFVVSPMRRVAQR